MLIQAISRDGVAHWDKGLTRHWLVVIPGCYFYWLLWFLFILEKKNPDNFIFKNKLKVRKLYLEKRQIYWILCSEIRLNSSVKVVRKIMFCERALVKR